MPSPLLEANASPAQSIRSEHVSLTPPAGYFRYVHSLIHPAPGLAGLGGFAGWWWRSFVLSRNSKFGNDHGDHQRAWVPGAGCPRCSRTAMGRRLWMRSGMRILICADSRRSTRYTDLAALPDHLTMLTRKYGPAHLSLNPAPAWSSTKSSDGPSITPPPPRIISPSRHVTGEEGCPFCPNRSTITSVSAPPFNLEDIFLPDECPALRFGGVIICLDPKTAVFFGQDSGKLGGGPGCLHQVLQS